MTEKFALIVVPMKKPNISQAERVELAIREDGHLFWNGNPVKFEQLAQRFAVTVTKAPESELHNRADKLAHYEHVAQIMSTAAKGGLTKIGFITAPSEQ